MLLSDLLDQMTYGELSQLSLGGVGTQGVQEQDLPKIIPHINLALIELYKRFDLKTGEVTVQQYDHIATYTLLSKFAQTNIPAGNTDNPPKINGVPYYIMDSIYQPFTDNILRIEKVYNELGEELYLNQSDANYFGPSVTGNSQQRSRYYAVSTPSYNSINIPYPEKENILSVSYRASHDILPIRNIDPATTEINIPMSLLEPLLLYVASRVNINRGTELSLTEGQVFMGKFELAIKRITDLNLMNTNDTENTKLTKNGWV